LEPWIPCKLMARQ